MPGSPIKRQRRERLSALLAQGDELASIPDPDAPAPGQVGVRPSGAIDFGALAGFSPRQWDAVRAVEEAGARYVLFGGAMGGGKSYLLRWYCVRRLLWLAERGLTGVPVMLASEDYPSLRDRQIVKVEREFPAWLGRLYSDHRAFGLSYVLHDRYGGGAIVFRNLDDPSRYASAEFPLICVDELTKDPPEVFDDLRNRLRWPGLRDRECVFLAGSNPGGVGHGWVRALWIDHLYGPEWAGHETEFAFVQSMAIDNPHLDSGYTRMLGTLPEAQRRAFRDGDWDVYIGQAFPEFSRATHVVDGGPVPAGVPVVMSYDWGFGKPYSVMWWWVDSDGRLWGFGELYGAVPGGRDMGLRQSDSEVAAAVLREEAALGIAGRVGLRLCDPTCFNRQPDPQAGGQRPSTAETFARAGLILTPGDPSRRQKLRQMHERLRIPRDPVTGNRTGVLPMLMVYPRCVAFIRTLPIIPVSRNDPEEIDTKSEDHALDSACLVVQSRPMSVPVVGGGSGSVTGVSGVGSSVGVGGGGLSELGSV